MRTKIRGFWAILSGALLFSLIAVPVRADVDFGLKGGFTLANVNTVPETFMGFEWQTITGLVGGAFLDLGLAKGFSLQPEALYVQKGAKVTVTKGEFTASMQVNLDYIEVPLLMKYGFATGGGLVPSIYAGPYLGFNTKAETVSKIEGYPEEREDIKENIQSTEYGAAFGVGLAQKLGGVKLVLDARYDLGLSNIIKDEDAPFEWAKTRTWLFMIGISF